MGRGPPPLEVEKGVYIVVFVGAIQGSRLHSRTCAVGSRRHGRTKKEYTNPILHPSCIFGHDYLGGYGIISHAVSHHSHYI